MFFCPCCEECCATAATVKVHIRFNHGTVTKFQCKQPGCSRIFDRIYTFGRHLSRDHNAEHTTSDKESVGIKRARTGNTDLYTNEILDSLPVLAMPDNALGDEHHPDDGLCIDNRTFKQAASDAAISYVSKLYMNNTLTNTQIQNVITSQIKLNNSGFFDIMKLKLSQFSSHAHQSEAHQDIMGMVDILQNNFSGLETAYKREKFFESSGAFIKPITYVIGPSRDEQYVNGDVNITPISLTGQFIPLVPVLKGFLELPGVLQKILSYMTELENDNSGVMVNVVQGKLWRERIRPRFSNKVVLPLKVFHDDFEPDNALGSHAGYHKLSGVFYSIACLPPQFQASLENIFVALIFHAHDRSVGNFDVFRPLLRELKLLETEGISVVTPEQTIQVYFALTLLIGDNLGLHGILGFVESFSANYLCRMCKEVKAVTYYQTKANPLMLRNKENYEQDVNLNDKSLTGVKERCIFNEISSYHVTENVGWDIMHDIDEGVAPYVLLKVINSLVPNILSLETLNNRVQAYSYGHCESGNKPPLITHDDLQKKQLSFASASEMRCFARHLPLMIGDLIPDNNEVWNLCLKLREIIDILTCPSISVEDIDLVSCLITEHHELYLQLFPTEHLRPKFHYMLHYPDVLRNLGPLVCIEVSRYESKIKEIKVYAHVACSRINLPLTVARKHQMRFCHRLLSRKGLVDVFETSRVTVSDVKALDYYAHFSLCVPPDINTLHVVKWANVNGTKYHKGTVVVFELGEFLPVFGSIHIISVHEPGEIYFVVRVLKTLQFHLRFHAYEVVQCNDWKFVKQKDLVTHIPSHLRLNPTGKYFVNFRHKL